MKTKQKHFLNVSRFMSLVLCLISCVLILTSCDTNEPPPESLSLTFEDASCTKVWLKLNRSAEGNYILKRDGKQVKQISLSGTDNIIYDDSLQPNTTYTYRVTGTTNNQQPVTSNEVTAVTMDTTSHDFTWETFTFGGQGGSSTLNDVAIIDENNIWAVGEIYTADGKYNAVHWDGSTWELKRIEWDGFLSQLRTVFAFSESDIWFGNVNLFHWDSEKFEQVDIPNEVFLERQNGIWGISSSDFYVVGNGGNIAHYGGNSWEKIESGTATIITDIWGFVNNQNETISYCTVSSFFVPGDKKY